MPSPGGPAGRSRPGASSHRRRFTWRRGAAATASWLRQLDEDAYAGALWRRPVVFVPVHLLLGALLGAVAGSAGALVVTSRMPRDSVRPGPGGDPVTVLHDYSFVPVPAAAVGAVLGLVAGALLILLRWRRLSRR